MKDDERGPRGIAAVPAFKVAVVGVVSAPHEVPVEVPEGF
jgi:hypothetical protein